MTGMPTWTGEPAPSSSGSRRWVVVVGVLGLIAVVSGIVWWTQRAAGVTPRGAAANVVASNDTTARAPAGTRVTVRIINTTGVRGLARRAMLVMRDFGYDVVDFDSEAKRPLTTTAIEVHTGHAEWAERVRRVLGTGDITSRPDTSRYVDLTIRIGRDWQAPTEPLRP